MKLYVVSQVTGAVGCSIIVDARRMEQQRIETKMELIGCALLLQMLPYPPLLLVQGIPG